MTSPYQNLPRRQFWKTAVEGIDGKTIASIYRKRYSIQGKRIATAGSCFAQEISKALRQNGYSVVDKEPGPGTHTIRGKTENAYGYGLYSARHGNIYTVRQLLQLTKEALALASPKSEQIVWTANGRYFDALRPNVEPNGLTTIQEVLMQRQDHLKRFRQVLEEADIFVFTLGLTESWIHEQTGTVYPTAPGVIAGNYDPNIFKFKNFTFNEIYQDFLEFRTLAKSRNPDIKFLLTVSPVPLTATAVDSHVLVSTVRSKSVLRAVTAQLYDDFSDVDYFPSYELFSTPFLGESMFKENRRSVRPEGVAAVMRVFFGEHTANTVSNERQELQTKLRVGDDDVICEEALLEAFAGERK